MKNLDKTTFCLALTLSLLAPLAQAKTTTFTVLEKKVSFDLPSDWQTVNKEVGIPLKLIGPMDAERRPVLLFVPIDVKEDKLIVDDKSKAEESYKFGRMAWLQTISGKIISFLPMKTYSTNNNKVEINQFGYLYQFDNDNLEEKSFYIKCKGQVFHMKSLIQVDQVSKWTPVVSKIVDSFKCD
jgi:hypothetical protein